MPRRPAAPRGPALLVLGQIATQADFDRAEVEALSAYVEQRFRVENHRTLYGASAMGVFVLHTLLERPDAFAGYIASSPTVSYRYDYMAAKATSAARKCFPCPLNA